MDSLQAPLLLIPSPPEPLDVHVQVPRPNDTLFERLIRDPQAPAPSRTNSQETKKPPRKPAVAVISSKVAGANQHPLVESNPCLWTENPMS